MAQLKDSVVSGNLRVTDTTLTDTLQVTTVKAPTTAGGTTYGPGTSGQVLKTNGTSVYWGTDSNAVTGVKGNAESTYRTGNVNLTPANIGALPLSGGTMTGPLTMKGEQYSGNYGLNMNNSDIIGANRIIFADEAAVTEGLAFWRSASTTDNFWIKAGEMYFTPNYPTATTNYNVLHTGNLSTYVKASSNNGKISVNGSDVTVYTHPTATAKDSGLYKITVNATGHVTGATAVTKSDIPALDYVPNTKAGVNAAINLLDTGSSTPVDGDYYISQYVGGGTTTTTYHRRPMSALASYIRTKLSVTSSGSGPVVTGMSYSSSTGVLTYTKGRILSTTGGQWISGRDNAPVLANSGASTANGFYPLAAVKTNTGAWSIGALGNTDRLAISFSTDENYSAGTNTTNNYYFGTDGVYTGAASYLAKYAMTKANIDTTPGSYVFGGDSLFGDYSADWVGFQADAGNDRFQIIANGQLVFRQNDSTTMAGNWSNWAGCLTPSNVSGETGITVTPVAVSYGTEDIFSYNSAVKIGHSNSITAQTSEVFKKFKYDAQGHITGVAAVAKADITALGIPAQDTTYSAGDHLSLSSTTFSLASYCKKITDWNDAKTDGWYMGSSVTNAPSTAWWMGRVTAHNAKYCIQEVWQFTANTDGHKVPHKMRMYVNEVWGNWVDITVGTAVPENAVFTDANVTVTKLAASTADASYYATFVSAAGTSGLNIMDSIKFNHTKGTTSAVGNSRLILGNSTASGTANNEEGLLRLYSPGTSYHTLKGASTNSTVDHTLPTTGGTILNTGTTGASTTNGKVKINGSDVTVYTHPTATAQSSGLYKITVNGTGHVTAATAAGPYAGASSDGGAATSANTLALKSLAFGSTLDTTTGLFAYSTTGSIYGTNAADWVGMQIGSSADRFQIMGSVGRTVLIRTNDNADGTISSGWSKWSALMTPASVVAGSGLTKTYGYFDGTADSDIIINATIGHSNSVTAQSTTVFKKFSYDACGHITGVAAVAKADIPQLDYIGAKSDGSYWGMTTPANDDSQWIRTSQQGIIPYKARSADATSTTVGDACKLGTQYWYFAESYIQYMYGTAEKADRLKANSTVTVTNGVQYARGGITVGTADGNAAEGSNASYKLWSYPAGGTSVSSGTANIQNLRLYWSSTYFRDIFISPNNSDIYHRSVHNGTANAWRKILDSSNYTSYAVAALKTLTAETLNTTEGSYVFGGTNLLGGVNDWVGFQASANNDRFQIVANSQLMFRQNDAASITGGTGWSDWLGCLTPNNVSGDTGITVTATSTHIGPSDGGMDYLGGVKISHTNSITAQSTTVFKKFSYDAQGHITGVAAIAGTDLPSHKHTSTAGGTWIKARDNANLYVNPPTNSGSYYPAIFGKTKDGGWSMGVLGGTSTTNDLYVTYTTDANYTADNNANTYQITFPKDSGTLALSKNHVAKSGDTMTGLLTMYREGTTAQDYPAGFKFSLKDTTLDKTYNDAYIYAYSDHSSTPYGTNMVINPGGCMFIGAGESAGAHYSAIKANIGTSEWMYLTADAGIYLQGKGNSIANRCGMYITGSSTETAHQIVPCVADTLTNNVGSIGTETYRWGYMFATQFNGKLGQYSSAVTGVNGRPTSANLTTAGDRTMQLIQSTSSMTTAKPSSDGYILNFDWDTTAGHQSQLFIANSINLNSIQYRVQGASATWENSRWVTVLTQRNSPAFNRIFDRYYRTPAATGWVRILTIGSFNNNGRVYGMSRITITRTYSNNAPEVLSFEVINNYNTSPAIYFLKSHQQTANTKVFTNVRVVKSSDGKEQYVDIYHSVTTQNYLSIRYEIFEPYDMLDTNNNFPVTTPSDNGTLTVLSTTPASADIMRASVAVPSQYDNNLIYANSYWGFAHRDGTATAYLRTTSNGLLPYQSGNVGSGHSNIGTSSWYFSNIYVDTVNTQQVKIKGTGTYDGTISNANATANRTVILPDSSGVIALMNVILENGQGVTDWDFSLDATLYRSFIVEVIMPGYVTQTATIIAHKYYPSAPCSFMMHSCRPTSDSSYSLLPAWVGLCYNEVDTSTPTWQFTVGRASKAISLNSNGTITSVDVPNTDVIKMIRIIGLTN